MKGERRTEEEDVSFLEALEEIFILIVFTVVDRRAVMSIEDRETVVELVDKWVRKAGLDSWWSHTTIILTLVAIGLVIAILIKISGLLVR